MEQWRQFSFKPPHLASLLINVFLWSHLGRQGRDKGHEETGGHDWVVEAWPERKRRVNRWNNGREFRITPQRCTLSIGRCCKNKVTNNRGNMKKSPPKHWSWWGWQVENSTWEAFGSKLCGAEERESNRKTSHLELFESEEQAMKENEKRGRTIWELIKREICAGKEKEADIFYKKMTVQTPQQTCNPRTHNAAIGKPWVCSQPRSRYYIVGFCLTLSQSIMKILKLGQINYTQIPEAKGL